MRKARGRSLLLVVCLMAARVAAQETCVQGDAAWSAQAVPVLQARSLQPYDTLEVTLMGKLPALSGVELTLQSAWPASRTAFVVTGRDCQSGEPHRQLVWFRTRALREVWVYGRDGKAETALSGAAPVRALVDMAQQRVPEAELITVWSDEFLIRSVQAGMPVRRSDVKPAPLVSRNAEVMVVVQGRGLMIRTRGTALQFGTEGEWVPVMVAGAAKSTRARVVAPGVVHVDI